MKKYYYEWLYLKISKARSSIITLSQKQGFELSAKNNFTWNGKHSLELLSSVVLPK